MTSKPKLKKAKSRAQKLMKKFGNRELALAYQRSVHVPTKPKMGVPQLWIDWCGDLVISYPDGTCEFYCYDIWVRTDDYFDSSFCEFICNIE